MAVASHDYDLNKLKVFKDLKLTKEYIETMVNGLSHSFKSLSKEEIREAVEWSIGERFENNKAVLDNNYTKQRIDGTVVDILNYMESLEPIVSSSGVLFKKHKDADNPLSRMIQGFLKSRKAYKKEMFKFPKGSEMFEKYNLYQLLEKLNANATYGALGQPTCHWFNQYVAEAVTRQGRSYITCSITFFEMFLANNIKFNSLDEIIVFLDNICKEGTNNKRKLLDKDILDRDITPAECFYKVMNTVDQFIWVPTESEMQLVWEYINDLSQEDINRIYYKNNLYSFCDLPVVTDLLIKILKEMEFNVIEKPGEPGKFKYELVFMDPNNPPKLIQDDLKVLVELIKEYVYYPYFVIDKLDRAEYMQRDAVIIVDTDSTIISFDAWYRFLLAKVVDIDMPIKHYKCSMVDLVNMDEFGDKPERPMVTKVEPEFTYDFYRDEVIEIQKIKEPQMVPPQDNLKYSIINIIAYVCSDLIVDYLREYTKLTGSYVEGTKCRMVMKNEFYFLKALITSSKKNYADAQLLQEGNVIPEGKRLAVMGLPINKSTVPDVVKKRMQQILYEDILTADAVDQVKIISKLKVLEKDIYNSIMNKETIYYKPDNIASLAAYENPMRINGVKAAMIYNELKDETMPAINLEERNKIFKIKINVTPANVDAIKDTYPETYNKMVKMLNHPTMKSCMDTIAFPMDSKVPDWILPFVNYKQIVQDNLTNFPLASIGLGDFGKDFITVSNIIQL